MQVWLKTNRRVLAVLLGVEVLTLIAGLAMIGWNMQSSMAFTIMGAVLAIASVTTVAGLIMVMRVPRLAYEGDHLLVYLQWFTPVRVPIEIVEVLFMGQGPSVPGSKNEDKAETKNAVIRLAEKATDWKSRPVRPELGSWCDGYIIIRGTWCEPLSVELLNALNSRLVDIHRQRRAAEQGQP